MKVSAIISAYYAAEYLEGRIANLLQQTLQPEVIVVCQRGSAESNIAMKFGKAVTKITTSVIPTVYHAWNMGIKASSGEYITNSNSDDRLYPDALEKLAKVLDEHPEVAVAYGDQRIVQEIGGSSIGEFTWSEGGLRELLQGCFLGPMPMWRSSLHAKYGYFDIYMQVAGDYEFWLRLAAGGEKFYHLKEFIGEYTRREGGRELREPVRTIWETARARAKYRGGVS